MGSSVVEDLDDFLGGQIVGDLSMKNLLMVHDVFEVVGLCYDHFFFLSVVENGNDHGLDLLAFLAVVSGFVPVYA